MFAGWYFLKTKENIKLNRNRAVKLTLSSIENDSISLLMLNNLALSKT